MTGTLAGALAVRRIPTRPDRLTAEVEGFIENVDGKRPDALRAIEVHEKGCPASQSVQRGIAIEWDGDVREDD